MRRHVPLPIVLVIALLALAALPPRAVHAQWVVPCDPDAPRGFACWPAPTLFPQWQSTMQAAERAAERSEEEQEPELVYLQEGQFQAPPPQPAKTPSLAEMALMSNYPQPIILQVWYHDDPAPPHRHRSFTEWRLDCQDRIERHCQALHEAISGATFGGHHQRSACERECCACPE